MARRRGFGEVERRVVASGRAAYRARYAMPDGTRHSRTFWTKMDAGVAGGGAVAHRQGRVDATRGAQGGGREAPA